MSKIKRRDVLLGAGAVAGTAALGVGRVRAQGKPPIKIGVLTALNSAQSQSGIDTVNGMKLFLNEIKGEVAGRKIDLIFAEDEQKPQLGLQKVRQLVESEKVDLVTGPQGSGVANGIVDYIKQTQTLWVISGAGLAALTRAKKGPLIFRTSVSTWQTNDPIGKWAAEHVAKEAFCTAPDYAGGRDTISEFKASYLKAGGKIIKEVYPPLGTTDFSAYLADIKAAKPPMVYCFYDSADAVNFVRQYSQFGLKNEIPMVTAGFTVDEAVLPAQGKTAEGIISSLHWAATLDTPECKSFVNSYTTTYGRAPGYCAEYGYVVLKAITEAVKATGGDTGKETLAAALRKVKFNAPRGPFSFDPVTQNVIQNGYIRKVVAVDGVYQNQVIDTIPDVRDPG